MLHRITHHTDSTQVSNPFRERVTFENVALVCPSSDTIQRTNDGHGFGVSFFGCQIVKSLIPPDLICTSLLLYIFSPLSRLARMQRSRNKINSRQTWLKQAALSMRRAVLHFTNSTRFISASPGLHLEVDRRKQTGKRCTHNTRSHTLFLISPKSCSRDLNHCTKIKSHMYNQKIKMLKKKG